jgi:hypothetical protein
MPTDHRVRLDDDQDLFPARPEPEQRNPEGEIEEEKSPAIPGRTDIEDARPWEINHLRHSHAHQRGDGRYNWDSEVTEKALKISNLARCNRILTPRALSDLENRA